MQRWKTVLILTLLLALAPLSMPVRAQGGATITSVSVPDVVPGGGTRLRLSPDGRFLAVWTEGAVVGDEPAMPYLPIHLFDLADPAAPKETLLFAGQTDHTAGVAFSPDSAQLVSLQRNMQFLVWDTASGALQKQFFPGLIGNAVFEFHPDGHTIAWLLSDPYQIALLNLADESYTRILSRHVATWAELTSQGDEGRTTPAFLIALAVAPDGSHVAAASLYGDIALWDVATGGMRALVTSPDTIPMLAVRTIAFSDDGATLYYNNNRDERLFALDVATGAVSDLGTASLGLFGLMGNTGKIAIAGPDSASVIIMDPANPKGRQEIALTLDSGVAPMTPGQRSLGTFAASSNRVVFGGFGNEETEETVIVIVTLPE